MDEAERPQIQYDRFGYAAQCGDLQSIQRMLTGENPVPVDCIYHRHIIAAYHCFEYVTPLLLACRKGRLAIVQELIRAGADVNWKHVFYKTPPHEAFCQNGGTAQWVKYFLGEAFTNVNAPITVGTPLHEACKNGESPEVVEALLAAGADVNATVYDSDANEYTPLMSLATSRASSTGRLEIARLLLAANCNVNQEMKNGDTALVCACRYCRSGDELVRWLLEHGARITPKALPACFFIEQHAATVKISCLLEHGMDINATDEDGRTALHWATYKRNLDLVCLLLNHNVDVSKQDQYGCTALMRACIDYDDDDTPIINILLEWMNMVDKKLIDLTGDCGYTAFHLAAEGSGRQVINELLNCTPNLFCQAGDMSSTALHCALDVRDESIRSNNLQCLVEHVNGYGLDGINI